MKDYSLADNVYSKAQAYTGVDYSDGSDIEDYLLSVIEKASDRSQGSEELWAAVKDWATLYHLCPKRADLLRPLAGNVRGKKILEAGSGCGAITRYLGEQECSVVALEGSPKRASITAARCRDLPNVNVVYDNFINFQPEEKFDIITFIGVLEYSNLYIPGGNAVARLLDHAKSLLTSVGYIIIAIENKLGLKYWNGAPEDHLLQRYAGIENQYTNNTVATFGKAELISLLAAAGYHKTEFLYPFPDYKIPDVIFSSAAFSEPDFEASNLLIEHLEYYQSQSYENSFSSTLAARSLMQNGCIGDFANSFLIVASPGEITVPDSAALAFTYSSMRKKPFCKENVFYKGSDGKIHMLKLPLYGLEKNNVTGIRHILEDEPFYKGTNFIQQLVQITSKEGWTLAGIIAWAEAYYNIIKSFSYKTNEQWFVRKEYVDLTPFNIIITHSGDPKVFDQEWVANEDVPLHYVFFRGLTYSLSKIFMYAKPAKGTPLSLIEISKIITNKIFPFSDEDFEDCKKREAFYFSEVMLYKIAPFEYGNIPVRGQRSENEAGALHTVISTLRHELNDLRAVADKYKTDYQKTVDESVRIKNELQNSLDTVKSQYETKDHEAEQLKEALDKTRYQLAFMSKQVQDYKASYASRNIWKIMADRLSGKKGRTVIQMTNEIPYGKIAVHLHLHYPELLPRITSYLKNILQPYDLFVTVTDKSSEKYATHYLRDMLVHTVVMVKCVENKGRDVKPFYTDLASILPDYDYVCHIHSKKSNFNKGATGGWLDHMLQHLMGSTEIVNNIFHAFENNEALGMVYPATFHKLPYWANTWLSNTGYATRLKADLKLDALPESYFSYPVGNMFWARAKAIKPLFDLKLKDEDYPPENNQNDGEIMHALERITPVVSRQQGYVNKVIKTDTHYIHFTDDENGIDFSSYFDHSLETLKDAIDRPQITTVSFDIFDTIICRALPAPDDLFDLMQKKVERLTGMNESFRKIRKEADARLRKNLPEGKDINLDDIYSEIQKITGIDDQKTAAIRAMEIGYEKQLMNARTAVVAAMDYAILKGKNVLLVSDTYFTKEQIRTFLKALGIKSFHKIYNSADTGLRKDTRTLFPYILEKENLLPGELLHVGDNEHSDLQIPGDLKICTCHVMRPKELFFRTTFGRHLQNYPEADHSFFKASLGLALGRIFDNPFPRCRSFVNADLRMFGYFCFGPLLLAFVRWIADTAKKDAIERIYFLSRDGEILHKIYSLLATHSKTHLPVSVYLEVSRKSLTTSFIDKKEDVDRILNAKYFGDSLQNFFRARFGLDLSAMEGLDLSQFKFESINDPVCLPADIEKVKSLAYYLCDRNTGNFEINRTNTKGYLQRKQLFDDAPKAVVDIGYSGTMQKLLNGITGKPIGGYYMLTYNTIRAMSADTFAKGLFGDKIDPNDKNNILNKYTLLFETILSSVKGPVSQYAEKCKNFEPLYEDVSLEESAKLEKLPLIHEGIMNFCGDFLAKFDDTGMIDYQDTDVLLKPFRHFIENPEAEDVDMLEGLSIDDHYCGNGVWYWIPPRKDPGYENTYLDKCLWEEGARLQCKSNSQLRGITNKEDHSAYGEFSNRLEYEIFNWYQREYESLPGWYKKAGQAIKVMKGTKKIRLEDTTHYIYTSKAEEIQGWYNKEYEILPSWYKKLGQIMKIITGKKSIREYL